MDASEIAQLSRDHPEIIAQAFMLCEGVVQRYIARITDTPVETLFRSDIQDIAPQFKKLDGSVHALTLVVVGSEHRFSLLECNSDEVVLAMKCITRAVPIVYALVLAQIDPAQVNRPERVHDTCMIVDPVTNFFAYSTDATLAVLLRDLDARIGFSWYKVHAQKK